jgi:hypothetical protein
MESSKEDHSSTMAVLPMMTIVMNVTTTTTTTTTPAIATTMNTVSNTTATSNSTTVTNNITSNIAVTTIAGAHGSVVVKALCYELEDRGFKTP